jgi:hypothetical protein
VWLPSGSRSRYRFVEVPLDFQALQPDATTHELEAMHFQVSNLFRLSPAPVDAVPCCQTPILGKSCFRTSGEVAISSMHIVRLSSRRPTTHRFALLHDKLLLLSYCAH